MRTHAQKSSLHPQRKSDGTTHPNWSSTPQHRNIRSILHSKPGTAQHSESTNSHDPADERIQRKAQSAGDQSKRIRSQIAAHSPQASDQGSTDSKTENQTAQIPTGSHLGTPLDSGTKEEMNQKIGFDFSNVRIHDNQPSAMMNQRLRARAFTYGSDIFFNRDEYQPHSHAGKKLLAHELTHVVQQSQMPGSSAQGKRIQRTTVGDVLDEFFSPFSDETLWVMDENDNYTRIVRTWDAVTGGVDRVKANLEANCADWAANHMTDTSWTPTMSESASDADPNHYREWVPSPEGTDPETCKDAFITYVGTKAANMASWLIPTASAIPELQTFELYTCSIGSFGIFATVNSIDCAAQNAEMNIWMFNSMDQGSFGDYANHEAFSLSGMERQYMWWNWTENHSWGAGGGGGGGGGSGGAGSGGGAGGGSSSGGSSW